MSEAIANTQEDTAQRTRASFKVSGAITIEVVKEWEDDVCVISCPSLPVCTQGDSDEHADSMLLEAAGLFLEGCADNGTLLDVLAKHDYTPMLPHPVIATILKNCADSDIQPQINLHRTSQASEGTVTFNVVLSAAA